MSRPSKTWVALLIGNSRLHWAWGSGESLHEVWHTQHLSDEAIATLVRYQFDFSALYKFLPELQGQAFPTAIANVPFGSDRPAPELFLASVVPQQTLKWQTYCPTATVITLDDLPLTHTYPTLGIDRALAVYSCVLHYQKAALVIDAGTALTFTGADATLKFVGGAILPGVQLQLQSLGRGTADLPLLDATQFGSFMLPDRWATQTETAMISGILYSLTAGVQGFINDWCKRYPDSVLVLTGGDRPMIRAGLKQVAPTLVEHLHVSDTVVMEGLCAAIALCFSK